MDLDQNGIQLKEGLEVIVYSEEPEADARVMFSAGEGIWVAEIDWKKTRTIE